MLTVTELSFVNREEELALLKSLFDNAMAGKVQVVFLAGEGGVGKTRLAHELGRYAKNKQAIFAVGTSYEDEGMVPYSLWIEGIRSVIHQTSTRTLAKSLGPAVLEVGRLIPELAVQAKELGIKAWLMGPEDPLQLVSTTDTERGRLFQSVTDLLIHASEQKPLLLFLDDVLWSDRITATPPLFLQTSERT